MGKIEQVRAEVDKGNQGNLDLSLVIKLKDGEPCSHGYARGTINGVDISDLVRVDVNRLSASDLLGEVRIVFFLDYGDYENE
ncbi:hypothetical protein F4560_004441 [Saccharothrix ecbatanensis]|uniref:Uncharacterized protein n=1 Tax=Saccharothrix ecbatanensis TaxID=1105145 RepID=A0A7W9M292_9PSEU|nr:hypothetical protein [Saccharothrix ecbatanensis]MBB5804673.1 hypothetical protein [Saccharothrix ecbatanensis]